MQRGSRFHIRKKVTAEEEGINYSQWPSRDRPRGRGSGWQQEMLTLSTKKKKKTIAMRKGSLEETVWGQEAAAAWCL